jgi:sulfate transporter 4
MNETSREEFPQSVLCKDAYADMAILCSFIVGVFQIVASFCQLGFVVSFLGHPVVSGFTSAAAIIIGLSQVQYTFGVKGVKKSPQVHTFLANLFEALADTNWVVFAFGIVWIVYLMVNRKVAQRIKHPVLKLMGPLGPLIACVIGVLIFELAPEFRDQHHVDVVKAVPAGMSPLSVARWRFQDVGVVLPTAITASLIGSMESIAIGKNLASKHGYDIEASQELLALGLANLVGSCFSCYPITGSFSRSAVNNTTGAKSQLAGLITSVWIMICLLFFTRAFYNLPKFALAAVVISSVVSLVAIGDAQHLYKVKKNDFLLWVVAFLGTLFLGVELGIGIAVGLSLLIVIYESARPQIHVLWRIPGTSIYRSVKQETGGNFVPGVFIARIGSSLYFANAGYVKETILNYLSDLEEVDKIQYVILEMTPVVSVDSTALHMLHDLVSSLHQRKLNIAFCMVGNRVMRTMELADLNAFVGKQWFFKTVDDAVHYCVKHQKVVNHKDERIHAGITSMPEVDTMTNLREEPATLGNEIGISNSLHDHQSAIFVHLKKGSTITITDISLILKKHHVVVENASVESAPDGSGRHSYLVVDQKSRGQLEDWKINLIREDLLAVLDAGGAPSAVYENKDLREINQKLDLLMDHSSICAV